MPNTLSTLRSLKQSSNYLKSMALQPLTDEMLVSYQDHMMEVNKEALFKGDLFVPTAEVMARVMEVPQWLRNTVADVETSEIVGDKTDAEPGAVTSIFVPCLFENPEALASMIKYLITPEAANELAMVSQHYPPEKKYEFFDLIVRKFNEINGISNKGIVGGFIRHVTTSCKALAVIMTNEAWMIEGDLDNPESGPQKNPSNFSEDPNAVECLLSLLETPTLQRQILQPFKRDEKEGRGMGKVVEWLPSRTLSTLETKGEKIATGRFAEFLYREKSPTS